MGIPSWLIPGEVPDMPSPDNAGDAVAASYMSGDWFRAVDGVPGKGKRADYRSLVMEFMESGVASGAVDIGLARRTVH